METLVIAIESFGSSVPEANFNLSRQLNDLVGNRAPDGPSDYCVDKVLSLTVTGTEYDEFTQTYEIYALAVVEVSLL